MEYPELSRFIARERVNDLSILERWKNTLLDRIKDRKLKSEFEYKYGEF